MDDGERGGTLITTTDAIQRHKFDPTCSDQGVRSAVKKALLKHFGIKRLIELTPLIKRSHRYRLSNTHVDLQVRTLPNNQVIVARVPQGDDQFEVLEENAQSLRAAGFDVLRIDNAQIRLPREAETGQLFFKSYTNALFLNQIVLIPAYGDPVQDEVARKLYFAALNERSSQQKGERNDPLFTIKQIPVHLGIAAIEFSASIRCSAREIHRLPSSTKVPQIGVGAAF